MESLNDRYGLPAKTSVEYIGPEHIAIVRFVARRLLVKDADSIVSVANAIHAKDPQVKVSLLCGDNICSKLIARLESEGIDVLIGEPEK